MKPQRCLLDGLVFLCFASLTTVGLRGDTLYDSSVNGNKVYRVAPTGAVAAFATINLLPEGLALGTNGVLHVGKGGASIVNRVSTSGFVRVFTTNTVQPYRLAFDSKGNLYTACQSSPAGRITKLPLELVAENSDPSTYENAADRTDLGMDAKPTAIVPLALAGDGVRETGACAGH